MRRPVIAGNWKMYKTQAETRSYFAAFAPSWPIPRTATSPRPAVHRALRPQWKPHKEPPFRSRAEHALGSRRRIHR